MSQKIEFVLKALQTHNFRQLCQDYGISTKTGYKWRERFFQHGLAGLQELSRRPNGHAKEVGEKVVCAIVKLKHKHPTWGPRKLRAVYARTHVEVPSESSFKRVLERAGLVEERRRRRARGTAGRLSTGRKGSAPNEIWTVDFKGWWRVANGRRCEPLTVRDEFSRYVLEVRAVVDAGTQTVRGCFERLFERYGLPAAIRSDNGAPFASDTGVLGLSKLSAWWLALGIDLERGRPGCPQDNGAHERMHKDIQRELVGTTVSEQQASFEEWRHTFNYQRPHESLGMKCPAELYQKSPRRYEGTPEDLVYPRMDGRRVNKVGEIAWAHHRVFISTALAGWSVGLEPHAETKYNVYFGRLRLGQLDEETMSFERSLKPAKPQERQ